MGNVVVEGPPALNFILQIFPDFIEKLKDLTDTMLTNQTIDPKILEFTLFLSSNLTKYCSKEF
jgi:hypothetical protein